MKAEQSAQSARSIDALLPQTQCTRCGYPTCRAYATAIARGEADIDRCAPGGAEGIAALANLLGVEAKPLNTAYGVEARPLLASIDEDVCIGCTKCIQACPVDAIVGAAKHMHTVIAAECTGCELCLPPCPVDCIVLEATAAAPLSRDDVMQRATLARERFDARNERLARIGEVSVNTVGPAKAAMLCGFPGQSIAAAAAPTTSFATPRTRPPEPSPISRSAVLEAIARGKARRAHAKDTAPR